MPSGYTARARFIDAHGEPQAIYRKIHLFDVDLVDKQESYRESRSMYPGEDVVTVDTPCGRIGLTICYDVRFPELFRQLVDAGATMFTVPAAFTATTGRSTLAHVVARSGDRKSGVCESHRGNMANTLTVDRRTGTH